MTDNIVKEYSRALFMLACEEGKEKEYLDCLNTAKDLFTKNPEYILLLSSPNISKEERLLAIDRAFGSRMCENVVSFIKLLCERDRIGGFGTCVEDYTRLYNEKCRIRVVTVTSSVKLTEAECEKIRKMLEKKYSVGVNLILKVDPSILGGIIIEAEDTVIDGSLKSKLRNVKDVIKA
ncbi:MAG: ATP synthase F1 subunit delta [Clostridia bacterium]|nr:ATP synthase F1 subunit delta [Clostridia bacterium]